MRAIVHALSAALAALLPVAAAAVPPTPAGSLDPTFALKGYIDTQFTGRQEGARGIAVYGQDTFIIGNSTQVGVMSGFVARVGESGDPVGGFGSGGTIGLPGFVPAGVWAGNGNVLVGGFVNGSNGQPLATILNFNADTGAPNPACPSPGTFTLPPTQSAMTGSQVTSFFNVPTGPFTAPHGTIVENNAAQNDFRSGVFAFDPSACRFIDGFGTSGRSYALGDFYAIGGAANRIGGGIIVGATQEPGKSETSFGAWFFDQAGAAGACGPGVKGLASSPGSYSYAAAVAAYYSAAYASLNPYGAYVVAHYNTANNMYLSRVNGDCTLDLASPPFQAPASGTPFGIGIDQTITSAATELYLGWRQLVNGASSNQVAIFGIDSGLPRVTAPGQFGLPGGGATGGRAAPKDVAAVNSTAYALAVQPDAKYVVAGQTSVNTSSSFVARYIGVERTGNVVEFYNTGLNHYFITADPNEAAAVDNGAAGPGWSRTGQTWKSGGPNRVCRFYGSPDINPATGLRRGPNSHFYTIVSAECAAVKLDPGWHFESYDFSGWPASAGTCPDGTIPVKRVYNGRFAQNDSNHRYTISDAIYNQMIGQGWSGENVVFCSVQ